MLILLSNTLEPLKRSSENLLVIIFGPELQTFSLTNQWVPIWFQRFLLIWRRDYSWTVDTPGGYTFHSYWWSAATEVPDAGATSKWMRYFFGWDSIKMTAEYISTSKAAVINVANKLATSEKT